MDQLRKKCPQLDQIVADRALEAAGVGITISDPHLPGNPIIYANPAFTRMTGYDFDEVVGRNCRFLQGDETDIGVVQRISAGLREQCEFTVLIKNYRKNKTAFWNELRISPIKSPSGELLFYVGFQHDVTERVLLEESLRMARQRQDELIEASGDFFWELNEKGEFVFASGKIEKSLGFKPSVLYGRPIFDLLPVEEREEQRLLIEEILLAKEAFRNLKLSLVSKSGQSVWLRMNGTPRINQQNQFLGFIGSGSDITDEQSKLIDTYRLSALGQVSAEIAHEIANPLAIIRTSLFLIERAVQGETADLEKVQVSVEKIKKMISRTQKIILGAKAMAKNGNQDPLDLVPLKELVLDSLELCSGKIRGAAAQIETKIDPETLILNCRPVQMSQMFINLISNACDAIQSEATSSGEGPWIRVFIQSVGGKVVIRVSNSGPNAFQKIDLAIKRPYQSTKQGSSGTGLGLHLVKKIVSSHGGKIEVDPKSDHTSVIITLPESEVGSVGSAA